MNLIAQKFLDAIVREARTERGNTFDAYVIGDSLGLDGPARAAALNILLAEGHVEKVNSRFVKLTAKHQGDNSTE